MRTLGERTTAEGTTKLIKQYVRMLKNGDEAGAARLKHRMRHSWRFLDGIKYLLNKDEIDEEEKHKNERWNDQQKSGLKADKFDKVEMAVVAFKVSKLARRLDRAMNNTKEDGVAKVFTERFRKLEEKIWTLGDKAVNYYNSWKKNEHKHITEAQNWFSKVTQLIIDMTPRAQMKEFIEERDLRDYCYPIWGRYVDSIGGKDPFDEDQLVEIDQPEEDQMDEVDKSDDDDKPGEDDKSEADSLSSPRLSLSSDEVDQPEEMDRPETPVTPGKEDPYTSALYTLRNTMSVEVFTSTALQIIAMEGVPASFEGFVLNDAQNGLQDRLDKLLDREDELYAMYTELLEARKKAGTILFPAIKRILAKPIFHLMQIAYRHEARIRNEAAVLINMSIKVHSAKRTMAKRREAKRLEAKRLMEAERLLQAAKRLEAEEARNKAAVLINMSIKVHSAKRTMAKLKAKHLKAAKPLEKPNNPPARRSGRTTKINYATLANGN